VIPYIPGREIVNMVRKPEIQYVGQFYIYGSEAQQLAEKKKQRQAKTRLPLAKLEKIEKIYLDPVALVGIAVAIFMLATLAVGLLQLKDDWASYRQMDAYVSQLKKEHASLAADYRESFNLEDVQRKASGLGMIAKTDAQTMSVQVTVPEPKQEWEMSPWESVVWFCKGLFA